MASEGFRLDFAGCREVLRGRLAEAAPARIQLLTGPRQVGKTTLLLELGHVMIEGVPVQFLPSHNPLADEAVERAATLQYEGVSVRVVLPEYLVALYLEPGARTAKRRERAAALMESGALDGAVLQELLRRFGLEF
jgi:hypothetical protein